MAFTPPYYGFKDSFSVREQSEVQALLDHTDTVDGLMDIYQFAQGSVSYLASVISGETTYTAFWTAMVGDAMTIASTGAPVDPDAPTLAEQRVINGMLERFYGFWPGAKRQVLEEVILYVGEKVENTTDPYKILLGFAGASMTGLGSGFFTRLAEYYITRAQEYLRNASVPYEFIGVVDDQPTQGGPVHVSCVDENLVIGPITMGSTTTNSAGYFRIGFTVLEGIQDAEYELQFTFTHPHLSSPVTEAADYVVATPKEPVLFDLTFTAPASSSTTILDTGLTVPSDVVDYLTTNGLTATRLDHIRQLGGFRNLPPDEVDIADPVLLELDALAELEVLQPDVAKNKELFDLGYKNITDIALASRGRFLSDVGALFEDIEVGRIHYKARAAHLYGINNAANAIAPIPDHELGKARSTATNVASCDCPDCRSAVSPVAYLTDLIGFIEAHLKSGGASVDIDFLEVNFHHRLGGLQLSCDQLNKPVCQNRIAAEALRHYLDPGGANAPTGSQLEALQAAEKHYLMQAYELLLNKLGTSYGEIRSARGQGARAVQEELAARLGFPVNFKVDTIEKLFIDLSDPENIVEGSSVDDPPKTGLETLFGLRDTNRDPLSDPDEGLVPLWKRLRLYQIWEGQDGLGDPFPGPVGSWNAIIDPDVVTVDDLRYPISGLDGGLSDVFDLWQARRSWIDAEFNALDSAVLLDDEDPPTAVEIPVQSVFKDMRMVVAYGAEHLLDLEDDAVITYTPPTTPTDPPVDYTVVDQFIANGNSYYHIAETPVEDLFGGMVTLPDATEITNDPRPVRSCPEMILRLTGLTTTSYNTVVIDPEWPEEPIDEIRSLLATTDAEQDAGLHAMALDRASARRLIELYDKNVADPDTLTPEGGLAEDEWAEFKNILIMVLKRRACHDIWRTEEEGLILGPAFFFKSISQPGRGHFPIIGQLPLIDPELIGINDVPEVTTGFHHPVSGGPASDVLADRLDQLAEDRAAMLAANDMQELLDLGFNEPGLLWTPGDPAENGYLRLLGWLADPLEVTWAGHYLQERLGISEAELRAIAEFGVKFDAEEDIIAGERERVMAILQRTHKLAVRYPVWLADESGAEHWSLRKANLPPWRATPEQRTTWLDVLARNSEAPIIDPDLIGPSDLLNPVPEERAYELWQARVVDRDGWLSAVSSGPGALMMLEEFDILVKNHLEFVEDTIESLRIASQAGTDIRPRLEQLNITAVEFNQLLVLLDLLASDPAIGLTDDEKTIVHHILVRVKKRRKAAHYRSEECGEEADSIVTLSPRFFRLRETGLVSYPPDPVYPIQPWLASATDQAAWYRKLAGRVEEERSLIAEWQEVLFEVDEAMMVHLRDALVLAAGDPDLSLIANARTLGDRFLIDLENNCCYKTNRVAAAIETLQQLLWKTRSGDILQHYANMVFHGDFDAAWEWMGSYANWRAAMFVFLYPENVLHPSLRKFTTQAFADVVEATRNNRRFSPADACHLGDEYTAYLKDLTQLDVACAQQAPAYEGGEACGAPRFSRRKLTYLFAKAQGSKRLYYAVADVNGDIAAAQTKCWNKIPLPDGVDYVIHGCHRYINDEHAIDHIYLFVTDRKSTEKNKFYALRYALQQQRWDDSEPVELEVSTDELFEEHWTDLGFDKFSTHVLALCVMKNAEPWQSPSLMITLKDGASKHWSFKRRMNGSADGFHNENRWDGWVTNQDSSATWNSMDGEILDCWTYNPDAGTGWDFRNIVEFYLLRRQVPGKGTATKVVRFRNHVDQEDRYKWLSGVRDRTQLMVYRDPTGEQTTLLGFAYDPHGLSVIDYGDTAFNHPSGQPTGSNDGMRLGSVDLRFIPVGCDARFGGDVQVGVLQERGERTTIPRIELVNSVLDTPAPGVLGWGAPLLQLLPIYTQLPRIGKAGSRGEQATQRLSNERQWDINETTNDKLVVPLAEATYFVPMQIALQLHANGHYQAALDWFRSVYDIAQPLPSTRKISYLLRQEEDLVLDATRMADWYADPLNPHAIASIRPHTYTRYTLRAIISCLLDYADAEFTADTSETVPRARELYEDALDLLKYLNGDRNCPLDTIMGLLAIHDVPREWMLVFREALERLEPIAGTEAFDDAAQDINTALEAAGTWGERLAAIIVIIDDALVAAPPETVNTTLEYAGTRVATFAAAGGAGVNTDTALTTLTQIAGAAYDRVMQEVTGHTMEFLADKDIPWVADDTAPPEFEHGNQRNPITPSLNDTRFEISERVPAESFYLEDPFSAIYISGTVLAFCVVPNPIVNALVLKAEVELFKIRNCMNIAGMLRELDPFAAPTDSTTGIQVIGAGGGSISVPSQRTIPPSAYRYRFLVERARQLVAMAQQVEAAFLSTLEKLDAERYAELRAEQDMATSKANIKLQDLKVTEAHDGVALAEMQRDRAMIQSRFYNDRLSEGLIGFEEDVRSLLRYVNTLQVSASASFFAAAVASGFTGKFSEVATNTGNALNAIASGLNSQVQLYQQLASFERRKQEWEFQLSLADQDVRIGQQQIKLANDRLRIVGQEREIAMIQNDHAKTTLDFLRNKFTSAELYEWMSGVLEDVYAWFLQEATAVAIMAENQLIFERNTAFPPIIRSDYWLVDPNQLNGSLEGGNTDRRGLTGSTRLLRDLTELDQAAFTTNSPKRQLSKTLSLSEIAPEELINLRTNGLARFYTMHEHFDRDYPGHYLRLIKRVAVTVIALTPATKGIRATLVNGGASTVFTGGDLFQERVIKRYPDEIALSSGVGDQGVFQMQGEGEFLNPFEGSGVQTLWEFRMDKAANPFDFGSIADVLLTIEYEALSDTNRRKTMAATLNERPAEAALAISLKNNLPDQWFDLHNASQSADPYLVSFNLNQRDLVPHVTDARVTSVSLFVLMKDEETVFNGLLEFGRMRDDLAEVQPQNGIAPTGMFAGSGLIGQDVVGQWHFGVAQESTSARTHFDNDEVDDVVLLIRYAGDGAKYNVP